MGLISKTVMVSVCNNVSYYENLGYNIPFHYDKNGNRKYSIGDLFEVKVSDLPPNSSVKVVIECDICKEQKYVRYSNYTAHNHNGKCYCVKCSNKLFNTGENNINWKYTKTDEERKKKRTSSFDIEFKRKVLKRDKYKCCCCNKNKKLVVHHLDGYDNFKELRYEVSNGITMCEDCHDNFHFVYGKGNNTKEQFEEWIGKTIDLLSKNISLQSARKVYCYENKEVYSSVDDCAMKLGIKKSRKEIRNCCDLKNNTFSVGGYHFIWEDIANTMSEEEKIYYILNQLKKPRKTEFIDLLNGIIYLDSSICKTVNNLKGKLTKNKYNKEKVKCGKYRFVPYSIFAELDKDIQNKLLNDKKINIYIKEGV